jgi:2,3,4,5-tetrahydropyridine-2-carboxylate N-succinyltransferase
MTGASDAVDDFHRHLEPASRLLDDLDAGRRRAALPDPTAPDGWRVDATLKAEVLELFRAEEHREWLAAGLFGFRDRAALPTKALTGPDGGGAPGDGGQSPAALGRWRIVPGGTSVRAGVYLGPGVTIMPPSFINVGAWIGAGTMIDSHVLVGSCAQVGDRVHLAAGVIVGGVLEPPGARPVIVEDGSFVGGGCGLYEGVLVGRGAVLAAGVVLTGTSRLYDLLEDRVLGGTADRPLVVPAGAVVVPGTRRLPGHFAEEHGLGVATAIIVKRRDERTDGRVALEEALR